MVNKLENIDVFILCGGFGRRLKKICQDVPKPLIKIGNRPFLDSILSYMSGFGFRRFILGIGYKAQAIRDYYTENKRHNLNILFSEEKTPLDTAGAVKNAKKLIKSNPFFVLNGDSYSEFNPIEFLKFHKQKKSLISVLLRKESDSSEYGQIKIDRAARIIGFNEKNSKTKNCLINAGVYIFDRKVFRLMPSTSKFALERDFFPKMSGKNIFGYLNSGFFIDIGSPERYLKAKRYFLKEYLK